MLILLKKCQLKEKMNETLRSLVVQLFQRRDGNGEGWNIFYYNVVVVVDHTLEVKERKSNKWVVGNHQYSAAPSISRGVKDQRGYRCKLPQKHPALCKCQMDEIRRTTDDNMV
ncbi:uncharacterized protein LOC110415494 [Herrania umbratica]|uniref:Uncharacterized protein LOC110415494 n=1 Tax=Herrania umbratica TaxID=108875 RepID=A0A6J1A7X3_9ROSI|nr:uncharacterized protein LOC110415494 [Herrania umbratica]